MSGLCLVSKVTFALLSSEYECSILETLGMLALKSVNQRYSPTTEILSLLESFRRMVNDCVEIGLLHNVTALKRLSMLSRERRRVYKCPAYYKASVLSRAVGILAARKKSLRRGIPSRGPVFSQASDYCLSGLQGQRWIPTDPGRRTKIPTRSADKTYSLHSL
jgi:hypothetical protein